ncbi:MAG: hypothetical protein ACREX5_15220 [Achromobacter pestifer]
MKTASAAFRLLYFAILLLPQTVSAEQGGPLPPLPAPQEDSLPHLVSENLQRNTWYSPDGSDWGVKVQEGQYVEVYLSPLACQRWVQEGKWAKPRGLHINGNPVNKAACFGGVNKAQYIQTPLDALDFEALLFRKRQMDRVQP